MTYRSSKAGRFKGRRVRLAWAAAPQKAVAPHIVPDALTKQLEEERLLSKRNCLTPFAEANALHEMRQRAARAALVGGIPVVLFARAKDVDALMGDFEELFARDCESGISLRRAVVRYWARVLRSIGPQIWQAIRRVGVLGSLVAAALKR